ncbi:DNA-3-methyladenine glycosylase family protein [Litoreibacter janthinus]|uniref:DNA-3-methyladenine glycosylase II n=1 Tax=Litoreibacter janthinus TaxID=670154 RepID=A0A1I6H7B9_9RHOB|nr:DNA-3-methyladenine glycosylase [Litoreibacter janthinus]SFR50436.1 DNA-3-methyladenine glycosylase II [Litoreibacter janthinus]
MRIIKGDPCVAEGAAWLAGREPRFALALEQVGPLPLRLKPEGFSELLSAIMGQQVSIASAAAINARLREAGMTHEAAVAAASEEELRACGLSRQKIKYAHALANSGIDFDALRGQSTVEVVKTLTAVSGIGTWTAEIYAMFSLGHADVFASGDLALQEAARILFELPARPKEKEMRQMALEWSPWQSVAARILWAYYRVAKDREGIT